MKNKSIKIFTGTLLLTLFLSITSCSYLLEEQPRSKFTPTYFKTAEGVNGGLTALYAHLRDMYGQGYYYGSCVVGTDEYTYGPINNGNFLSHDMSGQQALQASNSRSDVVWNTVFTYINTASGIMENAEAVGLSDALVAEACFFRAFDYFLLVQTFGGVPLDLGSGKLKFNETPSRISVRNTVPEVYTDAIFPDLITAIYNLPETGRVTGGVTKTVARLYLAKAYLTYGWWLQNPNDIPTYPLCDRIDPDGKTAQWYYQQAYDIALEAIKNPGTYGLQASFYDVNNGPNDRNNEILLYADHNWANSKYNEGTLGYSGGAAPENFACWMVTWNYTTLRSGGVASLQREICQNMGRPWTALAVPHEVINNTFAEKEKDTRYDGTFVTTYRGNWNKAGNSLQSVTNANGMAVPLGEVILTFLPDESLASQITYPTGTGANSIAAGEIPGRADYVITPNATRRVMSPALWKIGPYREDNGSGLGDSGSASHRPFNIAKFSELYFIAAEAAVQGATTQAGYSARELLNVIRARAGKWKFSNADNTSKTDDYSADMVAATPQTIDIDYILAERSREYFGEGYRWYDLVRTQTWDRIAKNYTIVNSGSAFRYYNDADGKVIQPETVERTIEKYHYLRPIPQVQIDGMEMTDAEKDAYQNPGYN
ncbi:MAG: RagB/SusD family nutrient uptake outer membrane protein [Prevotellaceae bacterium]|jgi:hypothetical protein|nr:RagB/SusD family nutrient uptake outer membrane protein [Prevotellaceae bacterium]